MPYSLPFMQLLCECMSSNTPDTTTILEQLETHQVCTATHCFESDADAFGVHMPSHGTIGLQFGFMVWLMCVALYLSQYTPNDATKSIGSALHHSSDKDQTDGTA